MVAQRLLRRSGELLLAILLLLAPRAGAGAVPGIPFELVADHIFIRGQINGVRQLLFCLDSGSDATLLNARFARAIGIPLSGQRAIRGVGGQTAGTMAREVYVAMPGAKCRFKAVEALDLGTLEAAIGVEVALILGADFFRRFVVEIDYAKARLRLYDPPRFRYQGPGRRLPIRFLGPHPYVRGTLSSRGQAPIHGEFLIDTGSDFTVIVAPAWVKGHQLRRTLDRTVRVRARGLGAEIQNDLGRIKRLQVGPFAIPEPLALFPHGGEFAAPGKAGSIGSGFFRRFRVILDYSRRALILEPNREYGQPDDLDMSGARLVAGPSTGGEIQVARVLAGSAAAAAGLLAGDVIVALDDRPASDYTLAEVRARFKKSGSDCHLDVRRGDQIFQVVLRLRRLL